METKNVIYDLRTKMGLSQEELAEKVYVTRQAVSRWENGETVPNTETLKLLSGLFGVSINTLLGSPTALYCTCCGMPLEDSFISREKDGFLNEDYCKWCYADGDFTLDFWKQYSKLGGKEKFEELLSSINFTEDIESIGRWIHGARRYFLQNFEDSGNLIGNNFHGFGIKFTAVEHIIAIC